MTRTMWEKREGTYYFRRATTALGAVEARVVVIVPLVSALVAEDDFSARAGIQMTATSESTEVEGVHLGTLRILLGLLALLVGSKGSYSKACCEAGGSKRAERQTVELGEESAKVPGVEVGFGFAARGQWCSFCPAPSKVDQGRGSCRKVCASEI